MTVLKPRSHAVIGAQMASLLTAALVANCVKTLAPGPASSLAPFEAPRCTRVVDESPPSRVPYYAHGRWGLADRSGAIVVEPVYDEVRPRNHGLFEVRLDRASGVIDGDGIELIAPAWERIGSTSPKHVTVEDQEGRVWLRDLCDQAALPGHYTRLSAGEPLHVVARDGQWALLDHHAVPVIDWSDTRLWRSSSDVSGVILQDRKDGGVWVLHADGRPWAPSLGGSAFAARIWFGQAALLFGQAALLVLDFDFNDPRACLYDGSGRPLVKCDTYRELLPMSEEPPLLWARTDAGWGVIEVVEGDEPRVLVEPRYLARTGDGLADAVERVVIDASGRIVDRRPFNEIEHGPLPESCRELVSWRRIHDPNDPRSQALEYLDAEGEVVERVASKDGRERFQPAAQGERWGLRDVCSGRWIVPRRYARLQMCGETRVLAEADDGGLDLYALDRSDPLITHIDAFSARCEHDRIFTDHFTDHFTTKGMLDLDGRELLAPRFHEIRVINQHESPLLLLRYRFLSLYASLDGVRYFEEPLLE